MKMLSLPLQTVPMSFQAGGNTGHGPGKDVEMSGAAMQTGMA